MGAKGGKFSKAKFWCKLKISLWTSSRLIITRINLKTDLESSKQNPIIDAEEAQ